MRCIAGVNRQARPHLLGGIYHPFQPAVSGICIRTMRSFETLRQQGGNKLLPEKPSRIIKSFRTVMNQRCLSQCAVRSPADHTKSLLKNFAICSGSLAASLPGWEMISLCPGRRSKEVINNNCHKFCTGKKDLSSINTV